MSQRKKLIVVVLVFLALAVVVVASLTAGKKQDVISEDAYEATCKSLVAAIAKKDYEGGHKLLSDFAKKVDTLGEWIDKTSILGNVYRDGEVKLENRVEVPAKDADLGARVQLHYTVTNPFGTSEVSCTVAQQDNAYVVDGFSSQALSEDSSQAPPQETQ